jgi:hypothetical protein
VKRRVSPLVRPRWAARLANSYIDRVFSPEHQEYAHSLASRENPANDPTRRPPTRIALLTAKKWAPGRTLRIRFLDGTDTMQTKVIRAACPWIDEANLDFAFGDDPQAEIRISFHADAGSGRPSAPTRSSKPGTRSTSRP